MTKSQIHQLFIDQLAGELEGIIAATRDSIAVATSDEHRAESKYDTFSLESSYLARGQSMRVEELTLALASLRALRMDPYKPKAPVGQGALVRLKEKGGAVQTMLMSPAAGGTEVIADGETVFVVTPVSPLGRAVWGRKKGDTFDLKMGRDVKSFTVVSVE